MAFIQKVKSTSGATAVQIAYKKVGYLHIPVMSHTETGECFTAKKGKTLVELVIYQGRGMERNHRAIHSNVTVRNQEDFAIKQ